jgi:hypothetical protein
MQVSLSVKVLVILGVIEYHSSQVRYGREVLQPSLTQIQINREPLRFEMRSPITTVSHRHVRDSSQSQFQI